LFFAEDLIAMSPGLLLPLAVPSLVKMVSMNTGPAR
jgi:hypothetical protein